MSIKIQELNTHYNFLMDFIGLAEVYDENGLINYSINQMERMQECCYDHLNKEDREKLKALVYEIKDLVYNAMDNMELKSKRLSK